MPLPHGSLPPAKQPSPPLAETAYQAGEIGVVELLDAYEAAREADLSVIALATDAALAAVEYDLAIGRTY